MTGQNVIFLMISNPVRTEGYFYHSHNKLKDSFTTAKYSSLDSPIVNRAYVMDIANEY
jgi:malate/lactate dehydrogenase